MRQRSEDRLASWISLAHSRPAPRKYQRQASVHPIVVEEAPSAASIADELPKSCEIPVGLKRQSEDIVAEPRKEPELVRLCRQGKWREVLERCGSNPEEATPAIKSRGSKRSTSLLFTNTDEIPVFEDTPLGIVCAATIPNDSSPEEHLEVINALCKACPAQVRASQLIPGHTPLRDALRNKNCSSEILKLLLSTDRKDSADSELAAHMADQDGLYPIDHIILGVHAGQSTERQITMIKEYTKEMIGSSHFYHMVNPVVRLLSLGMAPKTTKNKSDEQVTSPIAQEDCLLECVQILLNSEPALISMSSKTTGCTPLHVALRNYGQNEALIKELVLRDEEKTTFAMRNIYGDLPLHVACTVGVPFDILKLILEGTIKYSGSEEGESSIWSPHPLVWSKNQSGYTPVDLEWVRHIESGKGIYAKRSFYPLEASGILKHCRKQDEFYKGLLRDAVDKVIHQNDDTDAEETPEVESKFGALIDRISLIVQYAAHRHPNQDCSYLLHSASVLSRPTGSALPCPIMELFLWLYPDQVSQRDEHGNLPLHYALSLSSDLYPENKSIDQIQWSHWVQLLLQSHPEATNEFNKEGRLPLHVALDPSSADCDFSIFVQVQSKPSLSDELLAALTQPFPDSIDIQDPKTGLYPFMMAAASKNASMSSTFALLRRSPARCNDEHP